MTENISQKVEQINAKLRTFGSAAVQQVMFKDRDGKVIGQVRYGFKPQYVFDAVNEILQPENWRYEIVSKEIFDFQAVVEVKLFIRTADEWICKGSQTGQMNIVKKNVGDAYKGAVTDAIQKCFSLVSIGSDAYRGLLESVYKKQPGNRSPVNNSQPEPQHKKTTGNNQQRQENQSNRRNPSQSNHNQQYQKQRQPSYPQNQALGPVLDGISYYVEGNLILTKGKTWGKTDMLKAGGFRFNPDTKKWWKEVAMH